MDERILARVKALRANSPLLGITSAVQIARYELADVPGPFAFLRKLEPGVTVREELLGVTVEVECRDDDEVRLGDDDVTGAFVHAYEPGCVKSTARGWGNGDGPKFYRPSTIILNGDEYRALREGGMSKGVARDEIRAIIQRDMQADHERTYVSLVVSVYLDGQELASTDLWGIDMGSYSDPGEAYLIHEAIELVKDALTQAREGLTDAITKASLHVVKLQALVNTLTPLE